MQLMCESDSNPIRTFDLKTQKFVVYVTELSLKTSKQNRKKNRYKIKWG